MVATGDLKSPGKKSPVSVRLRYPALFDTSGYVGIGRQPRLRIWCREGVRVRVPLSALITTNQLNQLFNNRCQREYVRETLKL